MGRIDPVWRKAPVVLLRFPGVLAAIAITAFILGLAAASGPLFLASGASAAFEHELRVVEPRHAGVTVEMLAEADLAAFTELDTRLRAELAAGEAVDEPTVMLLGAPSRIGGDDVRVRLFARTGAVEALETVAGSPDPEGVWLSRRTARALDVAPGEETFVRFAGTDVPIRVAGVYADFGNERLGPYWDQIANLIIGRETGAGIEPPPPPLVVMEPSELLRIGAATGSSQHTSWAFPLRAHGLDVEAARRAASAFTAVERRLRDSDTPLGQSVASLALFRSSVTVRNGLTGIVRDVDETVAGITPPVRTLALSGQAVALLVVGAAAAFRGRRRRTELRLMTAQGVSPSGQGVRAVVECAPALALSAAAGLVAAMSAVALLGPSPALGASGGEALRDVALAVVVGVVLIGAVTASAVHRESRVGASRLARYAGRAPWEVAAITLAGAAYYQLTLRGSTMVDADGVARVDVMLLLFPLLFLAGMTGLATRLLRRMLPGLRRHGTDLSIGPYLAVRRLTSATTTALLLVTAAAMSLGLLVYAGALAGATTSATASKARIVTGSDVAATLPRGITSFSPTLPGSTVVARGQATLLPGNTIVDVLAVDPATFADGAHWEPGFAGRPLDALLAALAPSSDEIPVLIAGRPEGLVTALRAPRFNVDVEAAGVVGAFPGMSAGRPLVIVSYPAFREALASGPTVGMPERILAGELWARGPADRVSSFLERSGIVAPELSTAVEVAERPALRAIGWALGYLRALGVLAAVLALAATLLYLQERQRSREVSYALSSRMGLSARMHRRAVALELVGMLAIALVVGGVLALVAAGLVLPRMDPLPGIPPPPTFALPATTLLAAAAAVALVSIGGSWSVQRAADHARIGEVLRVAD